MQEEFAFSINRITRDNLKELSLSESKLLERRICELSELCNEAATLAISLMDDGLTLYEVLSILSEPLSELSSSVHPTRMDENAVRLQGYVRMLDCTALSAFSELLVARLLSLKASVSERDFLPVESLPETFIYYKNQFSDEAYDVFSQEFTDPRVKYADSLRGVFKALYDGEVGYALVPLEESGARLPTVSEQIYRGDFKINSVIPVFGFDGTADMRYALISKSYTVPEVATEDDRYLEIRLSEKGSSALSSVLVAAESSGADIYRVNSSSYESEGRRRSIYSVVLKNEGGDFTSILTYLILSGLDVTVVGIYKNLE
jgi:hypothetical protein